MNLPQTELPTELPLEAPKKASRRRHDYMIQVGLTKALEADLRARSDRSGRSMAEEVREALRRTSSANIANTANRGETTCP
jgi:hypothetical protein